MLQGTKSRLERSFSRTAKAEKGTAAIFGLLDLLSKRVNDQIAEYAAVQSEVARRLWGGWLDPFHACQPVKVRTNRHKRPEIDSHTERRRQF